jgi:ketosteroid isomerase-like protein
MNNKKAPHSSASKLDLNSIRNVIKMELATVEEGDADGFFSILTEDAIFLPPDDTVKQGDQLRRWMREFLEAYTIKTISYREEELVISADFAFERYSLLWSVTPRAGGESNLANLKGIHVLQRDSDGQWKIAHEIWNANPSQSRE